MATTNGVVFNPNIATSAAKTGSNTTGTAKRTTGNDLGINEFLKILSVQLSNQDPLEPMKDTDFIAQMAQFSALQQMTALNETFSSSQAYSMVGKDVLAVARIDGYDQQIYGKVSGVVKKNGQDYLQVGEHLVSPSKVLAVYNDSASDALVTQGAALVGKTVKAEVPGEVSEDGTTATTEWVTGTVSCVLIKNGSLYVKIGDKEVPVSYITEISDKAPDAGTEEA